MSNPLWSACNIFFLWFFVIFMFLNVFLNYTGRRYCTIRWRVPPRWKIANELCLTYLKATAVGHMGKRGTAAVTKVSFTTCHRRPYSERAMSCICCVQYTNCGELQYYGQLHDETEMTNTWCERNSKNWNIVSSRGVRVVALFAILSSKVGAVWLRFFPRTRFSENLSPLEAVSSFFGQE